MLSASSYVTSVVGLELRGKVLSASSYVTSVVGLELRGGGKVLSASSYVTSVVGLELRGKVLSASSSVTSVVRCPLRFRLFVCNHNQPDSLHFILFHDVFVCDYPTIDLLTPN